MLHLHPPCYLQYTSHSGALPSRLLSFPAQQHSVCSTSCVGQGAQCSAEHQRGALYVQLQSAPVPLHGSTYPYYIPNNMHSPHFAFPKTQSSCPSTIPTLFHFPAAASLITSAARTHQPTSLCRTRSRKAASTSSCAHFPSTAFLLGAPRNAGCCWDRSWVQLCSTAELMCLVGVQVPELTRCWGGFQVRSCTLVQDGEVEFA